MRYGSLYERLVANTRPSSDSACACWLWVKRVDSKGYGLMSVRAPNRAHPVPVRVHRRMYELVHGLEPGSLDPDMQTIEHLCETEACINPDHPILLPRSENTRAMWERLRERAKRAELAGA